MDIDLTKQMTLEQAREIIERVVENPEGSQDLVAHPVLAVACATVLVRGERELA